MHSNTNNYDIIYIQKWLKSSLCYKNCVRSLNYHNTSFPATYTVSNVYEIIYIMQPTKIGTQNSNVQYTDAHTLITCHFSNFSQYGVLEVHQTCTHLKYLGDHCPLMSIYET